MAKSSIKKVTVLVGAGAFVLVFGSTPARADETVVEKHTAESHSYTVENSAPVVGGSENLIVGDARREFSHEDNVVAIQA